MKTIRMLAGLLLLINGILHIALYIKLDNDPSSIGILMFGIIYIITGFLLFIKKSYPVYLGIIIPVIGMTLSLIKFGVPELVSLSALFKLIGLMIIICCGYILVNQRNNQSPVQ